VNHTKFLKTILAMEVEYFFHIDKNIPYTWRKNYADMEKIFFL
jgi:hypothetical protein